MRLQDQVALLLQQGRIAEAVALVSREAAQGDGEAQFVLANWRIWGLHGPRDLSVAHQLLDRAAKAGYADAMTLQAILIANGTGIAADWARGLQLLRQAAPTSDHAKQQLQLLDAMELTDNGAPAADLQPPEVMSERPYVERHAAILTQEECNYLIIAAAPQLQASMVMDPRTGQRVPHPIRTSDGMSFSPPIEDLVVRAINRRIAAASGTDVRQGEPLHTLRYRPGNEYRAHVDTLPGEQNQRALTALVYLNDRYQGGETRFTETRLSIKGRAGDAIIFRNLDAQGRPDPTARHAGQPVTSGMKWLCTRWIRQRPYHPWGMVA